MILGREHALQGCFHIVQKVVNNAVASDVDLASLGERFRLCVGTYVKAEYNRVRGIRKHNVGFGDCTRAAVDNLDLHFVVGKFDNRLFDGFDRALHVALDDKIQRL